MSPGSEHDAVSSLPALVGLAAPELSSKETELLERLRPAGVILFARNVIDAGGLRALCMRVHELLGEGARPPLIATDHEGGTVSQLAAAAARPPSPLALGWADDPGLTERVHRETASRLRRLGVNLLLAPVADVRAPENPVIATRAFSEDPRVVAVHVEAAVRGIQDEGIAACLKHWPGHGRPALDSHLDAVTVDATEAELERHDLPPFRAGLAAGARVVMAGHLAVPALDPSGSIAPLSAPMLQARLRSREGFDGVIMTDALEMTGFGVHEPLEALKAGCDLLCWARPIAEAQTSLEALRKALGARGSGLPPEAGPPDRLARLRGSLRVFDGEERAAPARTPSVYTQARRVGVQRRGPWEAAVRRATTLPWCLLDAASGDRLLRVPADSAVPRDARLETMIAARIGPPRASARWSPSESRVPEEATNLLHPDAGCVIATVRPFSPTALEQMGNLLRRSAPQWIVLLGDPALLELIPPELPVLAIPGLGEADIAELARAVGAS